MQQTNLNTARTLRRQMSLPEVLLWDVLRRRPHDLKFRRQHPLAPYVLDFFCREAALAIEIDGESHGFGNRPQRDAVRDKVLRDRGILTLRIAARDVLADLDAVVRAVITATEERLPLHHPAMPDGPPPREKLGEE